MATGSVVLTTEKRSAVITENRNFLAFGSYFEDYAQFSPHLAVYAFELGGMKPKTDFWNRSAILAKSQLIMMASSFVLKKTFHEPRPDGSNKNGFPSGHTATAFSGAEMLSMEYKEDYPWVPYAAYTVASGVGVLRVVHDKHYWSDVIFGAGLGILSTKIAYWTHQYKWNKKNVNQKDPFQNVIYKN
jgi:membrane-associated phospholipid phosphatase